MEDFKWEIIIVIIGGCGGDGKKQLFSSIL